jgi:CelD/BcsL family acetyltransferase involved in cellulose biosynthesis
LGTALARQRNDPKQQGEGGALRTAITSPDELRGADLARWRTLATHRRLSGPFVDPPWVLSWTEAFAPNEPLLMGAWDGRRLVGLAALQRVIESWGGRRLAVLQSRTNAESYRYAFLSWQGRIDIQEQLWRALCRSGACDVIRIEHVPDDSPTLTAAGTVAGELGWRCYVQPTFITPWCSLSRNRPWDHGLTSRFKRNLRRGERRLAELGDVRFEVVTGTRLKEALEVFYRLEASGWKGRRGTAVVQRPQVKRFYESLVDRAPADVLIPILSVGSEPVAAYVLRILGNSLFALKTGYDEAYAKYSPGLVLTSRVIRYALERGMERLDFMAGTVRWKVDWTRQCRPHYTVLLFAPSRAGQYAYWVRYGLREHAKRLPGVLRLARWLRARRS